jgi:hypothetical protein
MRELSEEALPVRQGVEARANEESHPRFAPVLHQNLRTLRKVVSLLCDSNRRLLAFGLPASYLNSSVSDHLKT